jgi:hypothetical protein
MVDTGIRYNPNTASGSVFGGLLYVLIAVLSNLFQIFLLRRGLVQSVTTSLVNTDPRQKEIIQSSFDLLGEVQVYFSILAEFYKN